MSNPDKCTAGLTFGIRFKLDDAAKNYRDEPHYIVDSGGSSKESRGFTLFLKDGKLYAVVSVPDEVWRVGLRHDSLCYLGGNKVLPSSVLVNRDRHSQNGMSTALFNL